MPGMEMKFHLSISLPHPFKDINKIILDVKEQSKQIPIFIFRNIMITYQNYLLDIVLASPRNGKQEAPAFWKCPRCGSTHGFTRRGWRSKPRQLKTTIGIVEFPLRNVSCKKCAKTFSPFIEFWGLEPWQRASKELIEKTVFLATQFSYSRSSNTLKELLNCSISPTTIHRQVEKHSSKLDCRDFQHTNKTLMFDDTKVRAGVGEGETSLLLGISVDDTYKEYGRNRIKKSVIVLDVDESWKNYESQLKRLKPESVVTDGHVILKTLMNNCFPQSNKQQCIWHLFKTSGYYFWNDGLALEKRAPLLEELSLLVKNLDIDGIKMFIKKLESLGMKKAANFIERGLPDLFTYTQANVAYKANSPIEREMRELNRRTDVGARWTKKGLLSVLNLRLAYEKRHDSWVTYWDKVDVQANNNWISIQKI